jgi:enoyl-CoA hydratase/carnithine racemase
VDSARAVVITADGPDFCHGLTNELDEALATGATVGEVAGLGLGPKASGLYKPVVVAVAGQAGEGAWHLIGEADIVIAAPSARFGGTGALGGRTCLYETVLAGMRLPIGEMLRLELAPRAGGGLDAQRAHQLGLVTEIVPEADLAARGLDVRVLVVTGAGAGAYCVGVDRAEAIGARLADDPDQPSPDPTSSFHYEDPGEDLCPKACGLFKPVIAAVNGMACGGALYLLGEVDIIVAAQHATFFDPHITYGLAASYESIHLAHKLPLGEVLRTQLMGANERMSAGRAHELGLVSEVVPAEELAGRARELALDIAAAPADRAQAVLRAVWSTRELGRARALALLGPH